MAFGALSFWAVCPKIPIAVATSSSPSSAAPRSATSTRRTAPLPPMPPVNPKDPFLSKVARRRLRPRRPRRSFFAGFQHPSLSRSLRQPQAGGHSRPDKEKGPHFLLVLRSIIFPSLEFCQTWNLFHLLYIYHIYRDIVVLDGNFDVACRYCSEYVAERKDKRLKIERFASILDFPSPPPPAPPPPVPPRFKWQSKLDGL